MATAHVPGSKSVTARALVIAALAPGRTRLIEPLVAADTLAFAAAVRDLGPDVVQEPGVWTVTGLPDGPTGASAGPAKLWCHDSGTAARFLPALAALGHGQVVIDASEQMRARPMAPLLGALRDLGVRVRAAPGDRLPLEIDADGIEGGEVRLDAGVSSQYLTALCLVAPATRRGLRIRLSDVVSVPYVRMTLAMMRDFGVESSWEGDTVVIPPGTYTPGDYRVEADASTASYFFAAAALTGDTVTVPGLGERSHQGDLRFATEVLASMGCTVRVTGDSTTVTGPGQLRSPGTVVMRDISDTMMTLAAIAPFADAPVRIADVANCRVKESDRIDAMATALTACGITVRTGPDWIEVHPGEPHGARVATRADHRIAMSLSVTGLRTPGIELDDPGCVAKTFPAFHEEFAAVREAWAQT
ncbi:3-phosphoshikimate 1-carboxyvinyltransferase [Kineosporia corallincola]|uniref:3-phosphoshikimate 1-carboxyvinyltransferase n=1 Tax=Kineosporia corallincola TaxID=2835133 RepID=UPI0035586DC8